MIFCFSGTGNSAWVAGQLSRLLGDSHVVAVGQALLGDRHSYRLAPGERLGFVFPTHCWGPPPVVLELMSRITIEGLDSHTYCYMVTTCGDDVGRCDRLMARAVRRLLGAELQAAFSVQMPNTYVCLPGFDVDPELLAEQKLQAAPARVSQVAHCIAERRVTTDVVAGQWAWLKSHVVRPLFLRLAVSDRRFRADASLCTGCGKCRRVCPVGNIAAGEGGAPRWQGRCTMCLACLHSCPTAAINWGHATRGKGRYTHPGG